MNLTAESNLEAFALFFSRPLAQPADLEVGAGLRDDGDLHNCDVKRPRTCSHRLERPHIGGRPLAPQSERAPLA